MSRKLVLTTLFITVLIGTLGLPFGVQRAEASGTIYIRADGSIEPSDAPISTFDNVTYTLTGNITSDAHGIIVLRSNVTIEGAGHSLQGTGTFSSGIQVENISNVTIKNTQIKGFLYGISFTGAHSLLRFSNIFGNHIVNNTYGISGTGRSYCIVGNNITNSERGIDLLGSLNNSIVGNRITGTTVYNVFGISLREGSSNNSIFGNSIEGHNNYGIYISESSNNTISGNNITANGEGVSFYASSGNVVYHNNFADNRMYQGVDYNSINVWDNGYLSGGNYWGYSGIDLYLGPYQNDAGSDGIVDTGKWIPEGNAYDHYPLMGPFNTFNAGTWGETPYEVDVVSNSTVSDFHFNPEEGPFLEFNVTGQEGTIGFCRAAIPKSLLWAENGLTVYVGEGSVNYTIIPDNDYTYLYFTYNHSTKTVEIQGTHAIPEFPLFLILPLFMMATLLAVIAYRREHALTVNRG